MIQFVDSKGETYGYDGDNDIPTTYVPARNTVFLSISLAQAEAINCLDIFIGVNSLD